MEAILGSCWLPFPSILYCLGSNGGAMKEAPKIKENIDVVISDVPIEYYEEIRTKLMKKGYQVQGYQKNFYSPTGKKV